MSRPAIVLLSGGLDSATVLALAVADGYECHALSFDYGQRHRLELEAAADVAAAGGAVDHVVSTLDLRAVGGSALTDEIEVPKGRAERDIGHGIPVTYVPARNTIFLSIALAWAEVRDARDIFVGVNAVDYSGYPDCRPEYLAAFEAMANLATRAGVEGHHLTVHAPLLDLTKADIVRTGLDLGVDYARTTSCYDPAPEGACGACDACLIRRRAFAEVGTADPAAYRSTT